MKTGPLAAVLAMICIGGAAVAWAAETKVGDLRISAAWARATPKGASVGGGYFTITNTGKTPDRLLGGNSDVSSRFELHEMRMENDIMKMRPISHGIDIKPGQTIEFKPGGYHVMFVGLKKPLEKGQHVSATLQFEKAGKVVVDFTVESIGASKSSRSGMQMEHHQAH
ncbi:MAG TPA: copper chaperone PCu(A)C [Pseudolabrys sp.]|nr:copper chaperone PCu(A)C [Pseudolabrys sp.]